VRATIAPGLAVGEAAIVSVEPVGSGLVIHNELKTSASDAPPSIDARRLAGSAVVTLRGSVPFGGAPTAHTLAVDNPTLFFVTVLRHTLIAHGITVTGAAVDIDDINDAPAREGAPVLLVHRSPPLSALATTLMKVSQNLYAETFLKTIGAADGVATAIAGRAAARATLQPWGVEPGGLIQRDGSGLSRYNYVTPQTIVTILTHVDRDDRLRGPFEAALPIAGRDGTLARRMAGTPAEGNARAKTGSIANARALSGYVRTADGEPLVFSILGNNFDTPASVIEQASDAIVVRLAEFRRH
jgi:D-alanyl-D-alanine carboxypeptidase/D-alanyl-D-alanine-endopeptidase (penicillin-binding protein 4)